MILSILEVQKQRHGLQASLKLANGYILPEGKMTPNTIFVGGIDTKVDENEIREFFTKYGPVKEVKIITYRGGICKGYAFVYFTEDVNIQTIVDQPAYFKGKKLKLGPAIMKDRSSRSIPSPVNGTSPWISPSQYVYCTCCPTAMTPPQSVFNGSGQYVQPYSYSNLPVVIPQTSMNYTPTPYAYQQYPVPQWCGELRMRVVNQNYVDCGVQTVLTLM
uniref:Deleted in azoospermia-like protein n=1 Tax=Paedocypris progenetica TaxID=643344 RepID=A0A2P1BUT3_9TELE|nr:deleted in azoospermia-like protein [Paedocypris progenetica]